MNKLRSNCKPSIAKLICRNYPIIKKRAPISFFFDDVRNNNCDTQLKETIATVRGSKKSPVPLRTIWRGLNPTQKMKYYKLSQLDEARYKEQTSLWVSKVASVVGTDNDDQPDLDNLNDYQPDPIKTSLEAALLMSKYEDKYELLIKADSTKKLMRDLIKQTENLTIRANQAELVSDLPPTELAFLSRPMKPPSPFVIFMTENLLKFRRLYKKRTAQKESFLAVVSKEWVKLSKPQKNHYLDIYETRFREYNDAMQKYLSEQEADKEGNVIDTKIMKARKCLSQQIRAKMRTSDVVPVQTRNPYIQFYKNHAYLRDGRRNNNDNVVNAYMNLPEEERAKYKKLFEDDLARYQYEKKRYFGIMVKLIDLMKKHTVEH